MDNQLAYLVAEHYWASVQYARAIDSATYEEVKQAELAIHQHIAQNYVKKEQNAE